MKRLEQQPTQGATDPAYSRDTVAAAFRASRLHQAASLHQGIETPVCGSTRQGKALPDTFWRAITHLRNENQDGIGIIRNSGLVPSRFFKLLSLAFAGDGACQQFTDTLHAVAIGSARRFLGVRHYHPHIRYPSPGRPRAHPYTSENPTTMHPPLCHMGLLSKRNSANRYSCP